jgi:hypothetical protein
MKELIQISNERFNNSESFGEIYYVGNNISTDPNYIVLYEGFIINENFKPDDILETFRLNGLAALNQYEGSYNVIIYSKNDNIIYVTNDTISTRSIYYYTDENHFVISNRFWNAIDIIQPTHEMLDIQAICRYGIYGTYMYHNSPINGLRTIESGSNFTFDIEKKVYSSKKYYQFQDFVENNNLTLEKSAEAFNNQLKRFRDFILERHKCSDLGLSVSGGLDSRILPGLFGTEGNYFVIVGPVKKNKLGLKPYNICYIDKIAKAYGIHIQKIDQSLTPVSEKIEIELRNFPLGGQNFIQTISPKRYDMKFNFLINAGHPDLLSGVRTMVYNGASILDIMENYEGNRYLKKGGHLSIRQKLSKLLDIISYGKNTLQIPMPTDLEDYYPIKKFDKKEFYKETHDYIENELYKRTDPNFILKYRYDNGADLCCGSFESLSAQVKETYSMFYPFGNNVLKTVPFKFVYDRLILKETIKNYYQNVYNIESEHSIVGIHDERKAPRLKVLMAIINQKLRGLSQFEGMLPEQKKIFLDAFDAKSEWFEDIFDNSSIRSMADSHSGVFLTYLKLKLILGTLEHRDWKKYCL